MKKFAIVLMALALLAGSAMAGKPVPEKPAQVIQGLRVDFTHEEYGSTCFDEAEDDVMSYNIIAAGDNYFAEIESDVDEDWFTVFVAADGDYTLSTAEYGADPIGDTKLYLYSDCTGDTGTMTEIAYNDDIGYPNYYSEISGTLTAGTYYARVTGFSSSYTGTYMLVATEEEPPPPPPANDTCEGALPLPFGGSFTVDMCGALNDYNQADADDSCTGYSTAGLDIVYYVDLVENQELTVECQTSYDIAIYLLSDCADMNSCVIGADATVSAGYETFVFDTADAPGRYYLILDGFSSTACDEWTVTVGEDAVATEDASFGTLKAMYR